MTSTSWLSPRGTCYWCLPPLTLWELSRERASDTSKRTNEWIYRSSPTIDCTRNASFSFNSSLIFLKFVIKEKKIQVGTLNFIGWFWPQGNIKNILSPSCPSVFVSGGSGDRKSTLSHAVPAAGPWDRARGTSKTPLLCLQKGCGDCRWLVRIKVEYVQGAHSCQVCMENDIEYVVVTSSTLGCLE